MSLQPAEHSTLMKLLYTRQTHPHNCVAKCKTDVCSTKIYQTRNRNKNHHQTHQGQRCKPNIIIRRLKNIDHQRISKVSKYFSSSHPATFLVKVLSVGICCPDLSKFPDSEIQLTPAFMGGGRVCPKDCLRVPIDILANFSAVSETPRAVLPLFIEAAKQT